MVNLEDIHLNSQREQDHRGSTVCIESDLLENDTVYFDYTIYVRSELSCTSMHYATLYGEHHFSIVNTAGFSLGSQVVSS